MYDAAKKFEKMEISDLVVQTVKGYSGRFLKQDGAGWLVATLEEAREKVSHAFRTRRSATKATSTISSSSGTTATTAATTSAVRRRVMDEAPEVSLSAPSISTGGFNTNQVDVGGGKRIRV